MHSYNLALNERHINYLGLLRLEAIDVYILIYCFCILSNLNSLI